MITNIIAFLFCFFLSFIVILLLSFYIFQVLFNKFEKDKYLVYMLQINEKFITSISGTLSSYFKDIELQKIKRYIFKIFQYKITNPV